MNPDLESRVAALEKWQQQKTAQQVSFPLDIQSQTILNEYFLSKIASFTFTNSGGQEIGTILVKQQNKIYAIDVLGSLILFTADDTTDVLTIGPDLVTGQQATVNDGNRVFLVSTDTLPSPLVDNVEYYIINSTGTTCQISSDGINPIDLTDTGTGTQYMIPA